MSKDIESRETSNIQLRDVIESDLPIFFEQQLDPDANYMAAFTARDPTNREAFMAHWAKILGDETITNKTILFNGQVAGSVASYQDDEFGKPEVTYWIGKEYWGKRVATRALAALLGIVQERPMYARVVKDNIASLRVLQRCGFEMYGEDRGYANARGQEVEEYILRLEASEAGDSRDVKSK